MKKLFFSIIVVILVLMVSSCTPLKRLKYLQDSKDSIGKSKIGTVSVPDYKITKDDNLYVEIKTSIPEMGVLFGSSENKQAITNTPSSLYYNSIRVSDSGYIQLPLLGKIFVVGKSINQINQEIQTKALIYINDAVVNVKLVNFTFTILGEVVRPGQYTVNDESINIFESIGMAGDLTVYGNRERLTIMRKQADGTYSISYVNLNRKDILSMDQFYIQPNDIIYVEPLKAKSWGFNAVPLATILSSVSTLILILNFIK